MKNLFILTKTKYIIHYKMKSWNSIKFRNYSSVLFLGIKQKLSLESVCVLVKQIHTYLNSMIERTHKLDLIHIRYSWTGGWTNISMDFHTNFIYFKYISLLFFFYQRNKYQPMIKLYVTIFNLKLNCSSFRCVANQ